ncbi:MAG: DNA polymerase III subunit alpha, partial [Pseudomonadota bacterium]
MSFVHLHVHSQYSLLDGAITAERLIERAKKDGMPAVAVTDHGNLYGALDFYARAVKAGIQPIIGIETYLTQGNRRDRSSQFPTNHIVLLARNNEGLKNLFRLVTIANFEGFYYKPRIDRESLRNHSAGLIGMSACLNGVLARALQENREDVAEKAACEFREIFGEGNYYVELMDNGLSQQRAINPGLIDLAKRLSLPVVATNDCHYLNREDAKAHDILLCIGTGRSVAEKERMRFDTDQFYVRTPEEMKTLFAHCPEAISNTLEIAKKCEVKLDLETYRMPRFQMPVDTTLEAYLAELAKSGLEERMPAILNFYQRQGTATEGIRERYVERLERELTMIQKTGFSGYFLIVQDFINYAKGRGIPVGPGRGSAAGSLVAYATRITDLDPIPYNLLFERFLNPERISMPDIDVDFCQDGRDEVIRYVADKYGGSATIDETRVAQITTFGKMQARAVIRDVGRAMGMPYGEVDRIAKLVPAVLNITLEDAFSQEPKFAELRKKDPRVDELLTTAQSLEGLTRHASVHAAGVVISDDQPLVNHLPLGKGQHDEVVTQWDMKGVEKIGLVKFDFLGLKTLTLLARAVKLVEEGSGEKIDLLALNFKDPKVFKLLESADTQGIFQLESSGMRDLVARLKPSTFEDIIALVALYRPGPLGSGMVDDFINRKHGRTANAYDLPQLEPILKDTYGVILYQEQVMQIASALADYSLGEADLLRRAMGKKIPEEMEKQEVRFLAGCRKKNVPEHKAKKIFDLMAKFAGYGFNKSHSAAYALISLQTAYMKAHHPIEFMAACMSIDRGNTDRIVLQMNECRLQGIEVLPPDVNESQLDFAVADGKIRFGLAAIKNVGDHSIEAVVAARTEGGRFKDLFDFCQRVDHRHVNKKVLESLIKAGAFDSTGGRRAQMIASMEKAIEGAARTQRDRETGQASLFGSVTPELSPAFAYEDAPEWEEIDRLKAEKESLGFYISGHPLLKFSSVLRQYANSDAAG